MSKKKIDAPQVVENDVADSPDEPQEEVTIIEKPAEKREPGIEDGVYTEYGLELSNGVTIPEVHVVVDPDRFPMDFDSLMDRGRVDLAMMLLLSDQTMYVLRALGANRKMVREEILPVVKRGMEMAAEDA